MSRSIKDTKEMVKVTIKANKTLESKRKKGTSPYNQHLIIYSFFPLDKNIGPLLQQYEQMQAVGVI